MANPILKNPDFPITSILKHRTFWFCSGSRHYTHGKKHKREQGQMVYLRMFMHSIFGLLGLDLYDQSITSDNTKCCVLAKKNVSNHSESTGWNPEWLITIYFPVI